ncbi:MAG: hypothetical protein ABID61_05715 [Candidatus Micrarchaeota archaeon]
MFVKNRKHRIKAKKIMGLASSLDDSISVLNSIIELRSLLGTESIELTIPEKLHIVKSMARAKVRAFKSGHTDNYKTFKEIDLIGTDLVNLL